MWGVVLYNRQLRRMPSAKTNNTLIFPPSNGDWWRWSLSNDDVPYTILGLRTNEFLYTKSLGTEASAQEVDTPEPFPALAFIRADTPLKCPEDLRLLRLAHCVILTALDCRAKVEIDREQDILDGDNDKGT